MKKFISLLLTLAIFCTMFAGFVFSVNAEIPDPDSYLKTKNFAYEVDKNGNAVILSYLGKNKHIKIPKKIKGNTVKAIESLDFEFDKIKVESNTTKVTIPNTVTRLGSTIFNGWENLEEIVIPDSVTDIGDLAFQGSKWYENQPDGVVMAGKVACGYKGEKGNTLTIPKGTKAIADTAFAYWNNLKTVNFSGSLKYIGDMAFYECKNLEEIKFPAKLKKIGRDAFGYCKSIKTLEISGGVNYEAGAFSNCKSLEKVTFASDIKKLSLRMFSHCVNLKSVDIPASVEKIGEFAFYKCKKLEKIKIPKQVTAVGPDAFKGTPWFKNQPDGAIYVGKVLYKYKGECPETVTVKKGTVALSRMAFDGKTTLEKIVMPDTVKSIGLLAFRRCKSLKTVKLPKKLKSLEERAFNACKALETITLPSSLKKLNNGMFLDCKNLKEVVIPESITKFGLYIFDGCKNVTIYSKEGSKAIKYAKNNDIKYQLY